MLSNKILLVQRRLFRKVLLRETLILETKSLNYIEILSHLTIRNKSFTVPVDARSIAFMDEILCEPSINRALTFTLHRTILPSFLSVRVDITYLYYF